MYPNLLKIMFTAKQVNQLRFLFAKELQSSDLWLIRWNSRNISKKKMK